MVGSLKDNGKWFIKASKTKDLINGKTDRYSGAYAPTC
jgi:hypothetical protein